MAITIDDIKVEFHLDPPVITFLQGRNMQIEGVRDTLREIEETEEGRMFDSFTRGSGMIVRADGNYPFGVDVAAMDLTILPPFVMKFESGASPFESSFGSLLGTFVESPGAIVQINNAKGALKVETGGSAPTAVENAIAVHDRVLTAATHNIPNSHGRRVRELGDVISGSVNDAGASTTKFITNLTESRDDFFNDQLVRFSSGNLEGHVRVVLDYNGTTKEITVSEPMIEAPDNGIDIVLVPFHVHPLQQIEDQILDAAADDHLIADSIGWHITEILKKAKLAAYKL